MIKRIKSNIKSPTGKPWTHKLGKNVLLIGPNESGKSSVVEAIQLAVSGEAYGLFFRNKTVKTGSLLTDLGAPRGGTIFAEAETSDGSFSRWEMDPGGRPKHIGPKNLSLPVSALRNALAGSLDTSNKFLFEHLASEVSLEAVVETLGEEDRNLLSRFHDGSTCSPTEFLELVASLGKEKREKKTLAGNMGKILAQGFPLAERTLPQEKTAAWEQLTQAIRLEWAKKGIRDGAVSLEAVRPLLLQLGDPSALSAIPGSVKAATHLEELIQNQTVYETARGVRDLADDAQVLSEQLARVEKVLLGWMSSQMPGLYETFQARVDKFLPPGEKLGIQTTGNRFAAGLTRDTTTHTALSGSAEARLLAAMASALMEDSIVIVDDRMWDSSTLAKTMQALEKSSCQILLMTTTKPRGRRRANWTYIELNREKPEEAEVTLEVAEENEVVEPTSPEETSSEGPGIKTDAPGDLTLPITFSGERSEGGEPDGDFDFLFS